MFAERLDIGKGGDAIRNTVAHMARIARFGNHQPMLILTVQNIIRDHPERREQARAICEWVKEHVTYTRDPKGLEMVQEPVFMITQINVYGRATGDCDDMATLMAALLLAAGFHAGFRVIGPRDFRLKHVYNIVALHGETIPMDATEPDFQFGQEHSYFIKKDVWV